MLYFEEKTRRIGGGRRAGEAGKEVMENRLKIVTFGSFHMSDERSVYTDSASGKNKMWSVLKYLIAYYGKPVPAERLAGALWSDEEYEDPSKLLRDIIYRLRKSLTTCFGDRKYVLFSQGNYFWNTEIDCWVDFLEFDHLLDEARDSTKSNEERAALYNRAISLYNGPFLRDSTIEVWTLNFTDYYRRRFLQAIAELADLYEAESLYDEIVIIYDKAITNEPYEESLYIRQIQTLINNGEYEHARQQYRLFEKILLREFGTKPSQDFVRLSFEIDRAVENQSGSLEEITQLLDSGNIKQGAFFCGPETFRQIYMLDKRSEERINFPVSLALVTFLPSPEIYADEKERELKSAMKTLRLLLMQSLRNGDVIAQYSKNQFILMLTVLNSDGGLAALRRIKYLFESKYGKEKGRIEYNVSPIGRDAPETTHEGGDQRAMPK